jgi:hypothetical protein
MLTELRERDATGEIAAIYGESGLLDDGFGEGGHLVSHNARSGTAKNPSPKLAVISPS